MIILFFVRFDIMKKIHEHLTDKKVIIDCGEEIKRYGYESKPSPFIISNG